MSYDGKLVTGDLSCQLFTDRSNFTFSDKDVGSLKMADYSCRCCSTGPLLAKLVSESSEKCCSIEKVQSKQEIANL
jgi:hypothetical protein